MAFNATDIISKTSSYTALATDSQINVSPSAATTITLPAISSLAASMRGSSKTLMIQNVSGSYAVTVTADTTKPDYIVARKKTDEAGPVLRTFASIQLTGATDYVLLEADPANGYWFVKEMGLSTSYHGAEAIMPLEFNPTAVGSSALNGMDLNFNDMTTYSSGYSAAIYIVAHNTGAKTGGYSASQMAGLAIDIYNAATLTAGMVGINVYMAATGSQTVTSGGFWGMQIYMEDMGTAAMYSCLFLSKANATVGTAYDSFIHMANQGSGATTEAFHFHGPLPAKLIGIANGHGTGFHDEGTTAGDQCVGHFKVIINGTAAYINLFSDNS